MKFLKEHRGELAEEFVDAMKQNGVDQQVYHSGMIVSNHCMNFCEDGSKIMNNLRKAMQPKFKDANNLTYLSNTSKKLKNIISLWYKMMIVMKSKNAQSDEGIT